MSSSPSIESSEAQRLESLIYGFAHEVRDRILKLEENVSMLQQTIQLLAQAQTSRVLVAAPAAAPVPAIAPAPQALQLKVMSMVHKWYTKRPMPDFEVQVVDAHGNLFVDTAGCVLQTRLFSGHGANVDQILNCPLPFTINSGRAIVSGLRFSAVSSRNGGSFHFQFAVKGCNLEVSTIKSPEFRILSERLKHDPKADSIHDLHSSDPLARVPGIGKKYAARMAELGVRTIKDLASMHLMDPESRKQLLDVVRRERGALTEAKLSALCRDAQVIVEREDEEDDEDADNDDELDQLPQPQEFPVLHQKEQPFEFEKEPAAKRTKLIDNEPASFEPSAEFDYAATLSEVDAMINVSFSDAEDDDLFLF